MCLNHYGSYSCECLNGFLPKYDDETFKCEDIDECSSECLNDCDNDTTHCVNLLGSFECKCKPGFVNSGKKDQCTDIDECLIFQRNETFGLEKCDENGFCVNLRGSFECICKSGFYGNGTFCKG